MNPSHPYVNKILSEVNKIVLAQEAEEIKSEPEVEIPYKEENIPKKGLYSDTIILSVIGIIIIALLVIILIKPKR